jgi:hypothetical protein
MAPILRRNPQRHSNHSIMPSESLEPNTLIVPAGIDYRGFPKQVWQTPTKNCKLLQPSFQSGSFSG